MAAGRGITPFEASDMASSTMATLEWAAQVRMAPTITRKTICGASAASTDRVKGSAVSGPSRVRNWCSAISTKPSPISTRPKSRGPAFARRKRSTPTRMKIGAMRATSKERIWTMSVVPTLAPSMTARAAGRPTRPSEAKPATMRPVAVLLCRIAVTPRPARNA